MQGCSGFPTIPPITVVVPVLDEEASLEELHARLGQVLPAGAEIIYADDGSTDRTPAVLREILARDPRARVVRLRRHGGKSLALAAGFARARGALIATIDADLQEDPAEISRLADRLGEGHDLVVGWRRARKDSRAKVWGSRLFNFCVSVLGGARFRDINCGLKVARREVLEEIVLAGGFHRFIPLLAHWKGFRVAEVEVSHRPRKHGASRYRQDRVLRGLIDLAVILFLVRHEGRPARYFAAAGTLMGLAGFGISAYLAWLRIRTGSIQERFPLLALGLVLLVVGVQLFSLGLFGELLAYHFRSRRPFGPSVVETGFPPPEERMAEEEAPPGLDRGGSPGLDRGGKSGEEASDGRRR